MRGPFSWALVATVPLVSGGTIKHNTAGQLSADVPTIQTAPTAAQHADNIEAVKISACCLNIASVLPGKVYGGAYNLSGYAAQSGSYYSNQEKEVKPACFVLPQSSQDVSTIIKALTSPFLQGTGSGQGSGAEVEDVFEPKKKGWGGWGFAAGWGSRNRGGKPSGTGPRGSRATSGGNKKEGKAAPKADDGICKFAIRSGGHTPIAESSNIQGGITLDLSFMKQVEVAPDRSYVNIGPGNRWQDVYSKLDAKNLGTSGGRAATVGVGGLVTGGGISFFSRERGLVCDNVIEFEVVLTDGSIVLANNATNPDLWRALKGGSGNFGIVTRIKMKAFELGNMWGGIIFHKKDDQSRLTMFKLFEKFTASTDDVHAHWIHTWTYVNAVILAEWQPSSNLQYTLPDPNPAVFARLRAKDLDGSSALIPQLMNSVKIDTLTGLTQQLASLNPDGSRQIFTSLSFKNSADFMEEVYQLGNDLAPSLKWVTGLRWSLSFQSLPKMIYSKAKYTGGNSLGLADEEDDLVILLLTSTWTLAVDDDKMYAAAQTFFKRVEKRAEEMGVDNSFIYLNYADKWQDPILGYGVQSVDTLRNVAARYDPKGILQKQVPGGFKIPKATARAMGDDDDDKHRLLHALVGMEDEEFVPAEKEGESSEVKAPEVEPSEAKAAEPELSSEQETDSPATSV